MTETRKWTIGAALIAVALMAAGWFLLISPERQTVADLEAQTAAQEDANSALQTDIEVLKQQNKDLPEKQAELAVLQTRLPDTPQLPTYIRELQDLGRKSGISFTSLTPAAPAELGGQPGEVLTPEMLSAVNVDMVVDGGYFEITKFMNELETASRYTLVGGYTIAEGEETDASTGSGDPVLTATINARIYLVPSTPELAPTPTTTTTP